MKEVGGNIRGLRKIARGLYTTAPRNADPVKGETILLERHESERWIDTPPEVRPAREWWTWTIAGGITDGIAYPTRFTARMHAMIHREEMA